MELWKELLRDLFSSYVGILSLVTIVVILLIAVYIFFWVKNQVNLDPTEDE